MFFGRIRSFSRLTRPSRQLDSVVPSSSLLLIWRLRYSPNQGNRSSADLPSPVPAHVNPGSNSNSRLSTTDCQLAARDCQLGPHEQLSQNLHLRYRGAKHLYNEHLHQKWGRVPPRTSWTSGASRRSQSQGWTTSPPRGGKRRELKCCGLIFLQEVTTQVPPNDILAKKGGGGGAFNQHFNFGPGPRRRKSTAKADSSGAFF